MECDDFSTKKEEASKIDTMATTERKKGAKVVTETDTVVFSAIQKDEDSKESIDNGIEDEKSKKDEMKIAQAISKSCIEEKNNNYYSVGITSVDDNDETINSNSFRKEQEPKEFDNIFNERKKVNKADFVKLSTISTAEDDSSSAKKYCVTVGYDGKDLHGDPKPLHNEKEESNTADGTRKKFSIDANQPSKNLKSIEENIDCRVDKDNVNKSSDLDDIDTHCGSKSTKKEEEPREYDSLRNEANKAISNSASKTSNSMKDGKIGIRVEKEILTANASISKTYFITSQKEEEIADSSSNMENKMNEDTIGTESTMPKVLVQDKESNVSFCDHDKETYPDSKSILERQKLMESNSVDNVKKKTKEESINTAGAGKRLPTESAPDAESRSGKNTRKNAEAQRKKKNPVRRTRSKKIGRRKEKKMSFSEKKTAKLKKKKNEAFTKLYPLSKKLKEAEAEWSKKRKFASDTDTENDNEEFGEESGSESHVKDKISTRLSQKDALKILSEELNDEDTDEDDDVFDKKIKSSIPTSSAAKSALFKSLSRLEKELIESALHNQSQATTPSYTSSTSISYPPPDIARVAPLLTFSYASAYTFSSNFLSRIELGSDCILWLPVPTDVRDINYFTAYRRIAAYVAEKEREKEDGQNLAKWLDDNLQKVHEIMRRSFREKNVRNSVQYLKEALILLGGSNVGVEIVKDKEKENDSDNRSEVSVDSHEETRRNNFGEDETNNKNVKLQGSPNSNKKRTIKKRRCNISDSETVVPAVTEITTSAAARTTATARVTETASQIESVRIAPTNKNDSIVEYSMSSSDPFFHSVIRLRDHQRQKIRDTEMELVTALKFDVTPRYERRLLSPQQAVSQEKVQLQEIYLEDKESPFSSRHKLIYDPTVLKYHAVLLGMRWGMADLNKTLRQQKSIAELALKCVRYDYGLSDSKWSKYAALQWMKKVAMATSITGNTDPLKMNYVEYTGKKRGRPRKKDKERMSEAKEDDNELDKNDSHVLQEEKDKEYEELERTDLESLTEGGKDNLEELVDDSWKNKGSESTQIVKPGGTVHALSPIGTKPEIRSDNPGPCNRCVVKPIDFKSADHWWSVEVRAQVEAAFKLDFDDRPRKVRDVTNTTTTVTIFPKKKQMTDKMRYHAAFLALLWDIDSPKYSTRERTHMCNAILRIVSYDFGYEIPKGVNKMVPALIREIEKSATTTLPDPLGTFKNSSIAHKKLQAEKEEAAKDPNAEFDLNSIDMELNERKGKTKKGPKPSITFPARLYHILARTDISSIISWLPHGRAWMLWDQEQFARDVMPNYFTAELFESFKTQVKGWGFRQFKTGPDKGAWFHKLFVRERADLLTFMYRQRADRPKPGSREPNFYQLVAIHGPDRNTKTSEQIKSTAKGSGVEEQQL